MQSVLSSLASLGAPPEGRVLWICVGAAIVAIIYGTVAFIRRKS